MAKPPQIQGKDKYCTFVVTGDTLEEAALKLVTERLKAGYTYDNWDDPQHQYEDDAKKIVDEQDGKAAWEFLKERSDFEYEFVEKANVI